jgi:uncharacterized protein (DUF433 family)
VPTHFRTNEPSDIVVVMEWQTRISVDPHVLVGKPTIKGTRISVELVIELLAEGWTQSQILASYPNLTERDIRACLSYASEVLHAEKVYPLKMA